MSIGNVEIKNFTVFNDIKIEFNQGINVLIGENGTGKTHLMKLLYAGKDTNSLFEYFKSISANISKNTDYDELEKLMISAEQSARKSNKGKTYKEISPLFINNLKLGIGYMHQLQKGSTFIPAKDMLTHSRGFLSMYDKFDMPYDKTYYDIISKSLLPNLKQIPYIGEIILPKLENIIGGKVVVDNETFFIEKSNGMKIEFALEAEGIKKFAILWQLIMNESITKGSILFWDEPEANINPKLLKDVVEILLELSRQGVQIFVATHNYIFAKYMEVLAHDTDNVSFHALYKTVNEGVQCESHRNFRDLKHNSIISSFDSLLDKVFDLNLGE